VIANIEVTLKIWQAQSLSDFVIGLYEYPDKNSGESLDSLAVQTPLNPEPNTSHLIGRSLPKSIIGAK